MNVRQHEMALSHPITNKIGGVFMHVRNMERSVAWYHRLFGLPERASVTDKVHSLKMSEGSGLVLDQHGYDRGLAVDERPLLMFDSPDVHAAYRYIKELGIAIEWEIEEYPGMAFFTFRDPDGNLLMVCGKPGNREEQTNDLEDKASAIVYDGGGDLLHVRANSAHAQVTEEGLQLTGRAFTEKEYKVPLRIETTVVVGGGSYRLAFGRFGELSFNYGPSADRGTGTEFYVRHPLVNRSFSYLDKGALPTNRPVHLDWTIRERSMEVRVDGQLFHTQEGYYASAVGGAGIGCDNGRLTVRSFAVVPLPAVTESLCLPIRRSDERIDQLVADQACFAQQTENGLWLTYNEQWGSARTQETYSAPFECRAVVHADTGSLVLYGGSSIRIKFHPDGTLSFLDSVSRDEVWLPEQGSLPANTAEVVWRLEPDRLTVTVDGSLCLNQSGDYRSLRFPIGIGPDQGCALSILSLDIRLL